MEVVVVGEEEEDDQGAPLVAHHREARRQARLEVLQARLQAVVDQEAVEAVVARAGRGIQAPPGKKGQTRSS